MEIVALWSSMAVLLAFGGVSIGAIGITIWARQKRRAQLEDHATRLGLAVRRDGALHGTWNGHRVWVFSRTNGEGAWETEIAVALTVPIGETAAAGSGQYAPTTGQAYAALPRLLFTGREGVAHALIRHPAFVTAATACPDLEIKDNIVRVSHARHVGGADAGLDRAVRVCEAVGEALLVPWHAYAEANGLEVVDAHRIEGAIGRRPVFIESTGVETVVAVGVQPALEGAIAHGPGARLGDPVLDGHVAVDAALVDRLGPVDDALRAALMEVFHQHPKSRAEASWITVRIDGRVVDGLGEPLSAAWTVAERLER